MWEVSENLGYQKADERRKICLVQSLQSSKGGGYLFLRKKMLKLNVFFSSVIIFVLAK